MAGLKDIGIRKILPKHINAGGLILSYVALDNASNQSYAVTTTMTNIASTDQTAKITFKAPFSGNVELQTLFHITDTDGTNSARLSLAISTNSSYSAGDERLFWQAEESDDVMINASWVLTGLTPGKSYTYYIAAKSSLSGDQTIVWSNEYPPFIIRAMSLPSAIVTDN